MARKRPADILEKCADLLFTGEILSPPKFRVLPIESLSNQDRAANPKPAQFDFLIPSQHKTSCIL